jgi:hypothetical protein
LSAHFEQQNKKREQAPLSLPRHYSFPSSFYGFFLYLFPALYGLCQISFFVLFYFFLMTVIGVVCPCFQLLLVSLFQIRARQGACRIGGYGGGQARGKKERGTPLFF